MSVSAASRRSQVDNYSKVELAKGQKEFTTSVKGAKNDLEAMRQKMESAKEMVLQTMILTSKNQMIGNEGGGKDTSTAMMNAVSTIANFEMSAVELEMAMKTNEMMQQSAIATTSQMVGKRVSLDDSSRNFSGTPVRFGYEIIGKNIPPNAMIQTQISIMDDEGKKILSKTQTSDKIGKNAYIWDGKDDNGEVLDKGKYSLHVSASYTIPGNKDRTPIALTATTVKQGRVDGVQVGEHYEIELVVDGQKMPLTAIRGISNDGAVDAEEETGPISSYLSYIGKKVDVEQNKVSYAKSKVNVPFISDQEVKGAQIQVRFFDDSNQFIGYAESLQDIKSGQNQFAWDGWDVKHSEEFQSMKDKKIDLAYLPVGTYRYEVSAVIKAQDGQETITKLDNKGSYEIDAVSAVEGKIKLSSGAYKFDVRDVKKVTEISKDTGEPVSEDENSLQPGLVWLRTPVYYKNNIIEYDGVNSANKLVAIPGPLDADQSLGDVTIKISDKQGQLQKTITIAAANAYLKDAVPVPAVMGLTPSSKAKVKDWFNDVYPASDWDDPSVADDGAIANYIAQEFRRGQLFQVDYDALAPLDQIKQRLQNIGEMGVEWDGTSDNGKKLQAGEYKFDVSYNITDNTGAVVSNLNLPPDAFGQVINIGRGDDGTMILGLAGGVDIPESRVTIAGIVAR